MRHIVAVFYCGNSIKFRNTQAGREATSARECTILRVLFSNIVGIKSAHSNLHKLALMILLCDRVEIFSKGFVFPLFLHT